MSPAYRDREQDKFKETPSGKTSVRVSVDSDSAVPVYLTESSGNESVRVFSEALSVVAAVETTVASYTVPVGKRFVIERVNFSGNNLARYSVEIDSTLFDRVFTHWATSFYGSRVYQSGGDGIFLNAGQVVSLKALHSSNDVGDFYGSIEGFLIND